MTENIEPVVSIIVPVYNAEQYLNKCINSILNQTEQNFELILVDDGSLDKSGEICDIYAKSDSRIKVLHVKNGGPAKARNLGIDIARGEYISFVDADDYLSEQMLEKLHTTAKKYDSDIVMCGYNIDKNGHIKAVKMDYQSVYMGNKEIRDNLVYLYYTRKIQGLFSLCNKLFKREFLQINKLRIDEKFRRSEDAWFVFEILKVAQSFVYIPNRLYYYVQNENSIMHTVQTEQYMKWVLNRQRLLDENKILGYEIDNNEFYYNFLYKVAVHCRYLIGERKEDEIEKILKDDFYRNAAKYIHRLPTHIKILHVLGRKVPTLAILCYKVWYVFTK